MGDLAAAEEDDNKAMDEYRAAIALKPSVPNLHYSLGHLLWENLRTAEARSEFEIELGLNPAMWGLFMIWAIPIFSSINRKRPFCT